MSSSASHNSNSSSSIDGSNHHELIFCSILYDNLMAHLVTLERMNFCFQIESLVAYILSWIKFFVILAYVGPYSVVLIAASIALYVLVKKHVGILTGATMDEKYWLPVKNNIAYFFKNYGEWMQGFEVRGLENVPKEGPALFIYYHGTTPIDFFYAHSKIYLETGRYMRVVGDRFLYMIPGFRPLLDVVGGMTGSVPSCIDVLNNGELLFISPGGLREGMLSGHDYNLIWGSRAGFAKIATGAKCPIIPVFTTNSREVAILLPFFKNIIGYIYEKTRLPLPIYFGMFPVKMVTYVGEPIPYDPERSIEDLKELSRQKLEELIKRHQRLPGSIVHGMLDRFKTF